MRVPSALLETLAIAMQLAAIGALGLACFETEPTRLFETRRRLEAVGEIARDGSFDRVALMLDSIEAGIPAEAPAELGPWIERVRLAAQSREPGALSESVASAALALSSIEEQTKPDVRAPLTTLAAALVASSLTLTAAASARSRRVRRRIGSMCEATGSDDEMRALEEVGSRLIRGSRQGAKEPRTPSHSEYKKDLGVLCSLAPLRETESPTGRLVEVSPVGEGHGN